jgi:hypothetical protein
MHKVLLVMVVVALAACQSDPVGLNCPDISRAAVSVMALDAASLAPVLAKGVLAVTDKAFAETVSNQPPGDPRYYAGRDRPGTYSVKLEIPGYTAWSLEGVVAKFDGCGVVTVPLAATVHKAASLQNAP